MPREERGPAEAEVLRRRAARERERAALCAGRAARHEARVATAGEESPRAWHLRIAGVQRAAELRHLMSAELHEVLAARLAGWRPRSNTDLQPFLMQAVAERLGTAGAVAMLAGSQRTVAMVAASDATARSAHDLELVLAEGPATDAARGAYVTAAGPVLLDRWPRYGPAVAELGIQSVCAAPLGPRDTGLGALCAYDSPPAAIPVRTAATIRPMADAVTQILLGVTDFIKPDEDLSILGFLDGSDDQPVIHQAVGMVSVQFGCQLEDAADLLAARAFADGVPLREVARQVVRGKTGLQ